MACNWNATYFWTGIQDAQVLFTTVTEIPKSATAIIILLSKTFGTKKNPEKWHHQNHRKASNTNSVLTSVERSLTLDIFICNDAAAFQVSNFYFILCNSSLKHYDRVHLASALFSKSMTIIWNTSTLRKSVKISKLQE